MNVWHPEHVNEHKLMSVKWEGRHDSLVHVSDSLSFWQLVNVVHEYIIFFDFLLLSRANCLAADCWASGLKSQCIKQFWNFQSVSCTFQMLLLLRSSTNPTSQSYTFVILHICSFHTHFYSHLWQERHSWRDLPVSTHSPGNAFRFRLDRHSS